MPLRFFSCQLILGLSCLVTAVPLHNDFISGNSLRGYEVPIQRRRVSDSMPSRRDAITGSVNLGDNDDLLYTVPIKIGDTVMPVHLDTGSSDLWVISDACQSALCETSSLPRYTSASLNYSGVDVTLDYGDSSTGTNALGPVGSDTVTIAGIAMLNQQFAAINSTTNPTIQYGASGIFGIGFPSGSVIQQEVVSHNFGNPQTTDDFLTATLNDGPLLSRMAMSGDLASPMFAINLQRDTIELSGNGVLSIGMLPNGVDESSVTWVPVRLYTAADGGLEPPTFAPNEIYPYRWEIELEGVYIDGKLMPQSTIPGDGVTTTSVSALIDTGNSLIRGPTDVVQNILSSVSPAYTTPQSVPTLPCATPHTLAFQIGGQMFPVDPANLITPYTQGNAELCVASEIVATDPPSEGALFSWSLGDPFIKSNLVAFYYGNLTNPSVDPPRIGLLSTVPTNANADLQEAVANAVADGGNFQSTIQYAPTASAEDAPAITIIPNVNAANAETSVSPVPNPSSSSSPPSATTSAPAASTQSTSSASHPVHDIRLALSYSFIVFLVYLL